MCRYGLRPAFAVERLSWTANGKIRYQYKRPAPNGDRYMDFEPAAFLARLAALVPPPRKHLTRYHGIFAPNHAWRSRIATTPPDDDSAHSGPDDNVTVDSTKLSTDQPTPPTVASTEVPAERTPAMVLARRLDWAALMLRVFAIDVLECPRCTARLRVLAFITQPDVIHRILAHLDLPTTPPDCARSPPT
ncbi:MAG: transposase [Proteobacteria bacterium]|nr:transposase [Pseudomonadota bacterium]